MRIVNDIIVGTMGLSMMAVSSILDLIPFNANIARLYGGVNGCVYSLNFFYYGSVSVSMRMLIVSMIMATSLTSAVRLLL